MVRVLHEGRQPCYSLVCPLCGTKLMADHSDMYKVAPIPITSGLGFKPAPQMLSIPCPCCSEELYTTTKDAIK